MNIRISNLDQKVTTEQLENLFKPFGAVSAAEVVTDVFTGLPRGFAFVEMPDDTDAQNAISQLNQSELESRVLVVEAAKPKEEHKGSYPVGNNIYKNIGMPQGRGIKKKNG